MAENLDILKIIYRIDDMANYYDFISLKDDANFNNFTNPQNVLKQIFYLTGSPSIYLVEKNLNNSKSLPKNLQGLAEQVEGAKNLEDVLNAVEKIQGLPPYIYLAELNGNYVNENNNVYGL